jgi:hypothetical protein
MTEDDRKRRNSLLSTLNFQGGNSVARDLRHELEATHGIAVTLDRVRADLRWLQDVSAVKLNGDLVQITSEGRDPRDPAAGAVLMAHSPELRMQLRAAYIGGLPLDHAAEKVGVPPGTARNWYRAARDTGDDWDRFRAASLIVAGGGIEQALGRIIAAGLMRCEALLDKTADAEDPFEGVKAMATLGDTIAKLRAAAKSFMPDISEAAVAADTLKALATWTGDSAPARGIVLADLLEGFASARRAADRRAIGRTARPRPRRRRRRHHPRRRPLRRLRRADPQQDSRRYMSLPLNATAEPREARTPMALLPLPAALGKGWGAGQGDREEPPHRPVVGRSRRHRAARRQRQRHERLLHRLHERDGAGVHS